jgi:hypothetical protein
VETEAVDLVVLGLEPVAGEPIEPLVWRSEDVQEER